MSGSISNSDLDAQFAVLTRVMVSLGNDGAGRWELVAGEDTPQGREPWTVEDGSPVPVMTLGYTRREALTALVHMNAALVALLEARKEKE